MQIIDKNGSKITVTNLKGALKQAKLFKDFYHTDPNYRQGDKERRVYWSDMYNKLRALENTPEQ